MVLKYSKPTRPAVLNRRLILGLSYIGVPRQVFLTLLDADVERIAFVHSQEQNLQKILRREINNRNNPPHAIERAKQSLLLWSKPNRTEEEEDELRVTHHAFFRNALVDLRDLANIQVPHSRMLLGVLDPTGVLKAKEVFVKIGNEVIEGPILLSNGNPMAPGDIRRLYGAAAAAVAHIQDCIVFSQSTFDFYKAGGQLDGSLFWVCWERSIVTHSTKDLSPTHYDPAPTAPPQKPSPQAVCDCFLDIIFSQLPIQERLELLHTAHAEKHGLNSAQVTHLGKLYRDSKASLVSGAPVSIPKELTQIEFPIYLGVPGETVLPDSALGDLFLSTNMYLRKFGFEPPVPVFDDTRFFQTDKEDVFSNFDPERPVPGTRKVTMTAIGPPPQRVARRNYFATTNLPIHHSYTMKEARTLQSKVAATVTSDTSVKFVVAYEKEKGRVPYVVNENGFEIISFPGDGEDSEAQIRIRVRNTQSPLLEQPTL